VELPADIYPGFGMAVLLQDKCLNDPESRKSRNASQKREPYCRGCVKSCPIEAVSLTKEKLPEFEDFCTGCGLCVQTCPTDPKAIHIVV
jgi:Na+-translocating ferredoxin:NAD+ oxidoreductase RNF subunit RnfB